MKKTSFVFCLIAGLNVLYALALLLKGADWLVDFSPRILFSIYLLICSYWCREERAVGYYMVSALFFLGALLALANPFLIIKSGEDFDIIEKILLFVTYGVGAICILLIWHRWWRPLCKSVFHSKSIPAKL